MKYILINNRYKIEEKLGEGGMGEVFLASDILLNNKKIAVKTIKSDLINSDNLRSFKNEFQVMTKLKHPNLIKVFDFGYDFVNNIYFITMEYLLGVTAREYLKNEEHNFSLEEVLNILVELCRALHFIHTRKIIHRDIKPGNIMIFEDTVKLMDFGLADLELHETQTKGTLFYMAPEILSKKADEKVDIFALGVTIYEMITNENLYGKSNSYSVLNLLENQENFRTNVELHLSKIDNKHLRRIIHKMTVFNPQKRYSDTLEIVQDINILFQRNHLLETELTKQAYVFGADFIGREKELSLLNSIIDNKDIQKKIVVVSGKKGTGKGRLCEEFKKKCQLEGHRFIQSEAYEKISLSYQILNPILNELVLYASEELIAIFGPALKHIVPENPKLHSIEEISFNDPQTKRGFLKEHISNFIIESAESYSKITILFLNDLHWTDQLSLEIIEEITFKINIFERNIPLQFLSIVQKQDMSDGFFNGFYSKLLNRNRVFEIELTEFDAENVKEYLFSIFGTPFISSELISKTTDFINKTGGNPLYLHELIKSYVENEIIVYQDNNWIIQETKEELVPNDLKSIIQQRIMKFSIDKDLLFFVELISCLNRELEVNFLSELLEDHLSTSVDQVITKLLDYEVIKLNETENKVVFSFKENLLKQIVYENIVDYNKIFSFICREYEKIYKNDLENYSEELAYYYLHTKEDNKKMKFLRLAGNSTREKFANKESIQFYKEWLKVFEKVNDTYQKDHIQEKIEILYQIGKLNELIGKWKEAELFYLQSIEVCRKFKENILLGRILASHGDLIRRQGDFQKAFSVLEESEKLLLNEEGERFLSSLYSYIGEVYFNIGKYDKALSYQEKAEEIAYKYNKEKDITLIKNSVGNLYFVQGKYQDAKKNFSRNASII